MIFVLIGMFLKGMAESSLLSKEERFTLSHPRPQRGCNSAHSAGVTDGTARDGRHSAESRCDRRHRDARCGRDGATRCGGRAPRGGKERGWDIVLYYIQITWT